MSIFNNSQNLTATQIIEETCALLDDHNNNYEPAFYDPFFMWYTPITCILVAALGFLMFLHPKFSMHPYRLIGIVSLMEAQDVL
jgi:hypothetical protein